MSQGFSAKGAVLGAAVAASLLAAPARADSIVGTGTVSGTFTNPIPRFDWWPQFLVVDGVGTSKLTHGEPYGYTPEDENGNPIPDANGDFVWIVIGEANVMEFVGNNFQTPVGETFVAGYIDYFNGYTHQNAPVGATLEVATASDSGAAFNQNASLPLTFVSTENLGVSAEADADYFYFTNNPELGSFRVFEGESARVEVLFRFNSLDLVGFGAVLDPSGGFVSASVDPVTAVPLPAAAWGGMVLLGGLGVTRRLRRRKDEAVDVA